LRESQARTLMASSRLERKYLTTRFGTNSFASVLIIAVVH
jgi:hypothetical protein